MAVEDEVRQISRLIACFIFRVNYDNDLEKYLNFYMEARGAFIRLDYVQSALVQVSQNQILKQLYSGYNKIFFMLTI